ncbi:hypothetical protein J8273_2684 [Carpediemonas membranifera]|uniref:Uncharacterized protein n=1 Tax=Carpediemonas membranifera TaxID=201153 RepID=A0A8J6BEH2_9EUKA|nr:hypothetical protein J8273_2684 [Carpediemonas membranifera]|eukprot:KAG9395772.1 hypothetical protein J8273_2684 [Carpediemonas membranifera]
MSSEEDYSSSGESSYGADSEEFDEILHSFEDEANNHLLYVQNADETLLQSIKDVGEAEKFHDTIERAQFHGERMTEIFQREVAVAEDVIDTKDSLQDRFRRQQIAQHEKLSIQQIKIRKKFRKEEAALAAHLRTRGGYVGTMLEEPEGESLVGAMQLVQQNNNYDFFKSITRFADEAEMANLRRIIFFRAWRVEWDQTPQPLRMKIRRLRAVRDKLGPGKYVISVTLMDRLGGQALEWKNLTRSTELWTATTKYIEHTGSVFHSTMVVGQEVYVACPARKELRPSMCWLFELYRLKDGRQTHTDEVVGWGVLPVADARSRYVHGSLRVPLLRGPVETKIKRWTKVRQLLADDLTNWLCNLYVGIEVLPRYLEGQREYQSTLDLTDKYHKARVQWAIGGVRSRLPFFRPKLIPIRDDTAKFMSDFDPEATRAQTADAEGYHNDSGSWGNVSSLPRLDVTHDSDSDSGSHPGHFADTMTIDHPNPTKPFGTTINIPDMTHVDSTETNLAPDTYRARMVRMAEDDDVYGPGSTALTLHEEDERVWPDVEWDVTLEIPKLADKDVRDAESVQQVLANYDRAVATPLGPNTGTPVPDAERQRKTVVDRAKEVGVSVIAQAKRIAGTVRTDDDLLGGHLDDFGRQSLSDRVVRRLADVWFIRRRRDRYLLTDHEKATGRTVLFHSGEKNSDEMREANDIVTAALLDGKPLFEGDTSSADIFFSSARVEQTSKSKLSKVNIAVSDSESDIAFELIEDSDQSEFEYHHAVAPGPFARILESEAVAKLHYLRRTIPDEVGLASMRQIMNARSLYLFAMLFLIIYIRTYIHTYAEYQTLLAMSVPVPTFSVKWYYVDMRYKIALAPVYETFIALAAGSLAMPALGCFMIIVQIGMQLLGMSPSIFSEFVLRWLVVSMFDPVLQFIVDMSYLNTSYGDAFKLYVYYNTEGSAILGLVAVVVLYGIIMTMCGLLLERYLLNIYHSGKIVDLFKHLNDLYSTAFVPHDLEISVSELDRILDRTTSQSTEDGVQYVVKIDTVSVSDPASVNWVGRVTRICLLEQDVSGSSELHRMFVRFLPSGAIYELYDDRMDEVLAHEGWTPIRFTDVVRARDIFGREVK